MTRFNEGKTGLHENRNTKCSIIKDNHNKIRQYYYITGWEHTGEERQTICKLTIVKLHVILIKSMTQLSLQSH